MREDKITQKCYLRSPSLFVPAALQPASIMLLPSVSYTYLLTYLLYLRRMFSATELLHLIYEWRRRRRIIKSQIKFHLSRTANSSSLSSSSSSCHLLRVTKRICNHIQRAEETKHT